MALAAPPLQEFSRPGRKIMSFEHFGLDPKINAALAARGFIKPTPIQEQAIPKVMTGRDLLGLAQTGTGKTAAFALPILQRLLTGARGKIRALVLSPTRELADQTHVAFGHLAGATGLRSAAVYGGVSMGPQTQALRGRCEIAVACPGRLLDHMGQGTADLSAVEVVVLDEADQMLDMGFLPDIRKIMSKLPHARQTLLFSATMPPEIRNVAHDWLRNPETVKIHHDVPLHTVAHALYPVREALKTDLLLAMLKKTGDGSILVFTRTKHRAKKLGLRLQKEGLAASSLQGNLSQNRRKEAMDGFRQGKYRVLVATDIAARGIDVSQITHVINYDVPLTPETYTHRIGRTGRAERTGDAATFVSESDGTQVAAIEKHMKRTIERKNLEGFDYKKQPSLPPKEEGGTLRIVSRPPQHGQHRGQHGHGGHGQHRGHGQPSQGHGQHHRGQGQGQAPHGGGGRRRRRRR
jgi:ATP-dependent RNA helicase RhlE